MHPIHKHSLGKLHSLRSMSLQKDLRNASSFIPPLLADYIARDYNHILI